MNFKDCNYMGKRMPLIVNKDVTSYHTYEHKVLNLIKGEEVIFKIFINRVNNKQYFEVQRENGDICLLSEDMVDFTHIPMNVIGNNNNNFKKPKLIDEVKVGMKVLTLESQNSDIGAGLFVTITALGFDYPDGIFEVSVVNQWGGEDEIFSKDIALIDETQMTRKKALELAIEALEYYKDADLSMVEEGKSHDDVSNELNSSINIIRDLIEIV